MARRKSTLTPVGDRGHAVTESGERVIGRYTPKGKDARDVYRGKPVSGVSPAAAKARRQKWEATPEGQARTAMPLGVPSAPGEKRPADKTPGYHHFMRTYDHVLVGPTHYDKQLPGMADPDAAPRPPKWDELSAKQRRAAQTGARAHGTSLEQMTRDTGAHLDQAVVTAATYGHARGHTEDFYSTGEPRRVVDSSADELGIPRTVHHQMNAMTSPQAQFSLTNTDTGEITYPNNQAAVHAVRYVQQRGSHKGITMDLERTGSGEGKATTYPENVVKAAKSFHQHSRGVKPADWVTGKEGAGPFESSPKTGPYANSWNDTHPQYNVSDVHTGGGSFLPHLGTYKAPQLDDMGQPKLNRQGNPKTDKSEREAGVASIPHFHAMADEAMRRAMAERNMASVRDAQALQWGQERFDRKAADPRFKGPTPEEAYARPSRTLARGPAGEEQLHFEGMHHYTDEGPSKKAAKKEVKGQESLF